MRIALGLVLASFLWGQAADKANTRYRTPEGREGMLATLGASNRAESIHADLIVKTLALKPGMTVADLGTGGGALLPSLSAAVGANGKVIAEDIYQDFLDGAKSKNAHLKNVTFVLGNVKDVALPAGRVDAAVTVDAYHHYDYPAEMLASIRRGLKPSGKFVVADYYRRPGAMPAGPDVMEHIRLDRDDVVKEIEANGFKLVETLDSSPGKQYIAVFALK